MEGMMNSYAPVQRPLVPTRVRGRHPRHASRGQALIIAVLIMFLLVGLCGLFIAMINHALVQTARADERDKLESIALTGLRVAQNELMSSADGADWRPQNDGPDTNNPGWVHQGNGFYRVTVNYGPQQKVLGDTEIFLADSPLERYLKIDVEARYTLENPPEMAADDPEAGAYHDGFANGKRFITRTITALVPIGITDNLLWITNQDNSTEPVVLGSALSAADFHIRTLKDADVQAAKSAPATYYDTLNAAYKDDAKAVTVSQPYLSVYEGPIRCDADLELGQAGIYLTNNQDDAYKVKRYDQVIVTGKVLGLDTADPSYRRVLANDFTGAFQSTGFDPVAAPDRNYIVTSDLDPLVRPIEAPSLSRATTGLDRYRTLTRDSGIWDAVIVNRDGSTGNFTGVLGQGEGIYIENATDVQHGGNLAQLREEWLNPKEEATTCWKDGVYDPVANGKAVALILHDWIIDDAGAVKGLPYIELRSKDPQAFYNKDTKQWVSAVSLPYPRNGVIFAEGNLVVKGSLPASLAFQASGDPVTGTDDIQLPGGQESVNGDIAYYRTESNRRYDLTIVSGGTVYIEGSLPGPATRHETYQDGVQRETILSGSRYDSKLALLAMDNVCLNPTRMITVTSPVDTMGTDRVWRATHDAPIQLTFNLPGSANNAQLVLYHAGEMRQPIESAYTMMQMLVNNTPHIWEPLAASGDDNKFLFATDTIKNGFFNWATPNQWSTALYPSDTFDRKIFTLIGSGSSLSDTGNTIRLYEDGRSNMVQFQLAPESSANYLISAGDETHGPGLFLSQADLQVDALIYAQRGSWFVIPGRYYNDDAEAKDDPSQDADWPFPKYHEPLDVRIVVNGAIVENRPAPLDAQEEWIKHWRGSNLSYATDASGTPALWDPQSSWDASAWRWTNRRMGIEYHYDASLARPVCYSVENYDGQRRYNYLPRLPKLPVSPTVFHFGALSGRSGA